MIISLINNKGGVLKTTLATNVAAALSILKPSAKVIICDLDGQGNVSVTFGYHPERLKNTLVDAFKGKKNVNDCVLTITKNLDILPCNYELSFIDIDVASANVLKQQKKPVPGELYTEVDVRNVIISLTQRYDYIVLDTPPTMATIISVCLNVSDLIVIPFEPDQYSLVGLMRMANTIVDFRGKNEKLRGLVVPTKLNQRTRLHADVINLISQKLAQINGVKLSKNFISLTTRPAASVGYERVPIVMSSIKTKYHDEYTKITEEILSELDKIKKDKKTE